MDRKELTEIEYLIKENEYYRARCMVLEEQWEKSRKLYHNMKNQYVLELEYLKDGKYQLLMEHYRKMLGDLHLQQRLIRTGNIGLDAILYDKAQTAGQKGILLEAKACIKGKITLEASDMCTVLGNLLDNALEAVEKIPDVEKRIAVVIKSDAKALLLQVCNRYFGKRRKNDKGEYLTEKEDQESHGWGLKTVKGIVEKYRGIMQIEDKDNLFSVQVFLYM